MAWNYFFTGCSSFKKLVQLIKDKNNTEFQSTINNKKYLCTAVDHSGTSLLHYAAEYGNEDLTNYLIQASSNVNLQNKHGQTPLILATRAQQKYVIKILLESHADVYIRDNYGKSALQIATHTNPMHANITRLFVAQVVRDSSFVAVESAKRLIEVNCPIYKAALLKGTAKTLSFMVKEGSPINEKDPQFGRTALHFAVKNLDITTVEFLVDAGADINARDNSKQAPIAMFTDFTSSSSTKWKIVKTLIEKGAVLTSCTDVGVMQMYWILRYGDRDAVRMIVESNVDFSVKDDYGQTPLHYLASNVYPGTVEEMKDVEIEVDVKDRNGMTALHVAMAIGNFQFVEFLVRKGASVNVKTDCGSTPIFQALGSTTIFEPIQRIKCINFLLERGACPENEIQCYFDFYDTDSAVNRDFELLKPLLALLIERENQGKLKGSEDIFRRIESYPNLKDYVDLCRTNSNNKTILSDVSSDSEKKFVVYEDSVSDMEKIMMESKCKRRMDVKLYEDSIADIEKTMMESKCKVHSSNFLNFSTTKTMSKRFCERLELKILDIFGTSIAMIFVTAYAILCVAPPQK